MDKSAIIDSLKNQLKEQYERAVAAVQDAAEAATGDDTKAESKYDTRGLEASYLAAGQVEQADRMARELGAVEAFHFPDFTDATPIAPGALVEGVLDGKKVYYLLAPGGGGLTVNTEDGAVVTVLGSDAPLRGHLLDAKTGAKIERPPLQITGVK
ncbi:MAG: hypothetical protein P1V20_10210 [Verrucomicrobiales bacterium]|nr:hypothetical protein [Verrucomicrobiales bacterium]